VTKSRAARARVATGLECFLDEGPACAALGPGARLGLVVHPASVDRELRHAADLLARGSACRTVRLFAPEHGVRGEAQDMEPVDGSREPDLGLPVSSLYGRDPDSLKPRVEDLDGLDAVVYDLQDVGARYYTFVYTLSYVMEAAAAAGCAVVVLDRPNPIGGVEVEGPVLDRSLASFVGRFPLPVRHGMTTGELAQMFRDAFGIACDLRVVPMLGWRRRMQWEETGLPWVAPSPNMPSPDTARVYPGGCLVEGTNLSEGRGTTRPFELVGAPWLSAADLAATLHAAGHGGARFRATSFRPVFHKHAGRTCHGIQVHVVDRAAFRPFATYLAILREAILQEPAAFRWREEAYEFETERLAIDLLLGRPELRPMLEAGVSVAEMEGSWSRELAAFAELRSHFLRYTD
jgi:uncharacterized protein YbbC (DUF1343 family)